MVQPLTVIVLADEEVVDPEEPGIVVELETEPPPAWTWTELPPAELELETPPPPEELPAPLAVVMLPSAFRLTVTVQVWPAALVPCLVIVSACALAWVKLAAATALTSTNNVVAFMARLLE